MSERDDDIIEFDFFDEPSTVEHGQTQRVRMPRRRAGGGRPPRARAQVRPAHGFTPLLRLVGLIAFAILIVVLLVFWVQSCQANAKKDAYRNYMRDVSQVAAASDAVGNDLANALTTPGEKKVDLVRTLGTLAGREQTAVAKAQSVNPPGPLRDEHAAAIEALQFDVSGLQGLAKTLTASQGAKTAATDAQTLGQASERFIASDVVWADLFNAPAVQELQKEGVTGVQVPSAHFLADPSLVTTQAWGQILTRLSGASTGGTAGGVHGTALEYVKALPSGTTLSPTTENTVTATTDLAFAVGVKDSGNSQEVGIDVTLTIEKPGAPIVKTGRIQVIDPGQVEVVTFKNLGQVPFAQKTTLKVDIAPVPNEKTISNNSGQYPVIFSLG